MNDEAQMPKPRSTDCVIRALNNLSSLVIRHSSLWGLAFVLMASLADAQTLNLPPRPAHARSGSDVARMLVPLAGPTVGDARKFSAREAIIAGQILQGNVPDWLRQMVLVTTNATVNSVNYTVSYYVTPDYLAIGSNEDYFLTPMTPLLAQYLADQLNCTMPTAKMVDDIWRQAPCKLAPSTIPPSGAMTTVPVFIDHNNTVRTQRSAVTNTFPLGILTGGDKKDVIVSGRIYSNFASPSITNTVVIYGWHQLNTTNIQNVYNGHEETYADYSHGIRLVQMDVTLNGQPNTVTNILKDSAKAKVISNDPYYSSNTIPVPRYRTFIPVAPLITTQPFSQSVVSNSTVTFSSIAIGGVPLAYQWKHEGTNLPGATNAVLILTNVQPPKTGTYSLFVSNSVGSTNSIPTILKVQNPAHPLLFADDFQTNSAARWNLFWGAANNVADYTIDWAHDYGGETYTHNGARYFIPPAPNSKGATRGLKLTVNNNDTNGFIVGVNLYPKNHVFSNDYALKFDLWINYPGGLGGTMSTGSTEHAICGLNHLGTQANWAATTANSTDGLWFGVDGEGGTTRDYRAYVGNLGGVQTELIGAPSGLSQADSSAAIYQTLFPASRFESPGAPGKQWVQAELRQSGGVITWLLDGTIIAQRTNTSAFTSGTVMIGYMDVFTSIANPTNDAFVIFDNVRVENLTQTLQAPAITSPPQNQQCFIGSNATFAIVVGGTAPISYQWKRNGVAIQNATNSILLLTNVQTAVAGDYSVIASNMIGTASATATLTVVPAPGQIRAISRTSAGEIAFTVSGSSGESYNVEASTNFVVWDILASLTLSNGSQTFTDAVTNLPWRYYRARPGD